MPRLLMTEGGLQTAAQTADPQWRRRLFTGVLVAAGAMGAIALPYLLVATDALGPIGTPSAALAYVFLLVAALWRKGPLDGRILCLIGFLVVFSLGGLMRVGFQSGPTLGLAVAVVTAALLMGTKALVTMIVVGAISFLSVGWLASTGRTDLINIGALDATVFRNWVRAAVAWTFLVSSIGVGIRLVVDHLETSVGERSTALAKLRAEREERQSAEAARDDAHRAMERMEKTEAVGTLAGSIAHDFNNALVVILAWADLLKQRPDLPPEAQEAVAEIATAGAQAARLTRQILSLSKRQMSTPVAIDPRAALEDTIQMLRRLMRDNVEVRAKIDPETPRILMDPGQFQQILLNLCMNARDAMPDGGVLTVELKASDEPPVPADQIRGGAGRWVLLVVGDTGQGMSPETQARAFHPFFTTKGALGTGIGLSTVRSVVEARRGVISVESRVGEGSRFTVGLRALASGEDGPEPPEPLHGAGREGLTILVAEDDPPVRRLIASTLQDAGHDVITATNGAEALEVARRYRGTIDVLCTDGVMPELGGEQLAEAFRVLFPGSAILVCSGYVPEEAMRRVLEEGKLAYLAKPFTGHALIEAVDRAVASRPTV